ncbi:hypothetical protein HMPREF9333_01008 [Johnsonella ignava ATCC 51276]|uniref:Major facilitator superfamily (MFS) profile domain-containing protein n=1 Tax=Johnsonella ignava ATCC 51276 TaxID=679200 RepID=G5GHG8_9FIRM|nr:peptide MFS transporter [Johnsonella ignava]EHI55793.1 hypothetical protein HMPREF9333_01008 [Johnsonella ignava ATCC 51276]
MENSGAEKSKYPIGFYIGCLTYSFERFAFYGTKPLLVLYLTAAVANGGLAIPKAQAAIIAANFTAYTYIAPLIGGYICDKWLGARYAVTLGCIIMGIGYLMGWKSSNPAVVNMVDPAYGLYASYIRSLGVKNMASINMMIYIVSIGTGLFKGNLAGLMGRMIEDDSKMDAAFSIQYSFVNIGAFFGSAIMGVAYMQFFKKGLMLGFREVFLFCAVLMFIGGVAFTASYKLLHGQGRLPFKYLTDAKGNVIGEAEKSSGSKSSENKGVKLTKKEINGVIAIIFVSFVSIIFWTFYEQQSSALTLYAADNVDMTLGAIKLSPVHVFTTWNGLLCIFMSLGAAKLWATLAKRPQGDLTMFQKVTIAFAFLGLAYTVLIFMELARGGGSNKASVLWLLFFGILLTTGEICFSPLGNSFVNKVAPKKYLSLLLGVWIFATFAANKLTGYVQGVIENYGFMQTIVTFSVVSFITMVILFALSKPLNKLVES